MAHDDELAANDFMLHSLFGAQSDELKFSELKLLPCEVPSILTLNNIKLLAVKWGKEGPYWIIYSDDREKLFRRAELGDEAAGVVVAAIIKSEMLDGQTA